MADKHISLLIVEDNRTQAIVITDMLLEAKESEFKVTHVTTMKGATAEIQSGKGFDIILLDLNLPDSDEMLTVARMRSIAIEIPIVVITSRENERLMKSAIREGVHDYLIKKHLNSFELSRAILFSIDRQNLLNDRDGLIKELDAFNDQLQDELKSAQASNEALTSWRNESVTAKMVGIGQLKQRREVEFNQIVADYQSILEEYLEALGFNTSPPRAKIYALAKRIGDLGGSPHDVIAIHLKVVHNMSKDNNPKRVRIITTEGRLLALEVMGNLVDYYRQGGADSFKTKEGG